jgi:hypothetical protein
MFLTFRDDNYIKRLPVVGSATPFKLLHTDDALAIVQSRAIPKGEVQMIAWVEGC